MAEYINDFLAYAFVGLLNSWMADGMRHPPELMGRLLYQLVSPPVLKAAFDNLNDLIR